jgi:serine phosphatase RsbU (regulator of sigma subunit)
MVALVEMPAVRFPEREPNRAKQSPAHLGKSSVADVAGLRLPVSGVPEPVFRLPACKAPALGFRLSETAMPVNSYRDLEQKQGASVTAESRSRWSGLTDALKVREQPLEMVRALQFLLKLLQNAGPEYAAGIFLLDEETRTIQGQVTDLFDRDLMHGEGALQAALHNAASFVISDLAAPRPDKNPGGVHTQIAVPFRASPRVRGALILRSRQPGAFTSVDGRALSEFAVQVSSVVETVLLHQKVQQEANNEVERDLVMAHEIMARLIPHKAPSIPGFEVASVNIPAKIVGGDLLDYLILPDDHTGFLVADASGHGIPSALLMTGFRALFRGLIQNDFNIRSVFRKANQQLVESTAAHQFVSAFYASLDASTCRLIYVNGGHVPPLLVRPGQPPRRLDVGGPVLGVLANASYHEDSVVLHPNDILVCCSDGLSEAENAAGESFDAARILDVVERNQDRSAEEISNILRDAVHEFAVDLYDDLTILVLKFP